MSKARWVTTVRTIPVSRHEVFAAWTQPDLMRRWGVDDFTADPRPGGHYRQVVHDDLGDHVVSGEYREFIPDQRLVMTWNYEGPGTDVPSQTIVTVELIERGSNTTDVMVVEEPVPEPDVEIAQEAWDSALADLESLLIG